MAYLILEYASVEDLSRPLDCHSYDSHCLSHSSSSLPFACSSWRLFCCRGAQGATLLLLFVSTPSCRRVAKSSACRSVCWPQQQPAADFRPNLCVVHDVNSGLQLQYFAATIDFDTDGLAQAHSAVTAHE